MNSVDSRKFKFAVTNSPDDQYTKIGVSERFGFGFMRRDSGYVSPLFGPEIYDIKKKYDFNEEEMIEMYMFGSVTYYPDTSEQFHGAFDILYDGGVYTYSRSAESNGGDGVKILKQKGLEADNDPVIFNSDNLDELMETGEAIALWPLIKKAHR